MKRESFTALEGGGKAAPWRRTRFNEWSPRFSPDGRWIAYESDESGDPEIYLALTEGGGEKRRISPSGGRAPRWGRDGKELYYLASGNQVMAVPITPGSQPEPGKPAPNASIQAMFAQFIVVRRSDSGDTPNSIVEKANAFLAQDDLDSAVKELSRLRGPAARQAEPWLKDARRRLEIDQRLAAIRAELARKG